MMFDDASNPNALYRQRRTFSVLVLLTVIATFALIVIGGVVRVTGSGLGCPDWPMCHGRIIPPADFHTLIEYSHRLSALLVSILVIAVGVLGLLKYRDNIRLMVLSLSAVALLLLQIVLGGVTVLAELPETVVTAHLGVAGALLAILVMVFIVSVRPRINEVGDYGDNGRSLLWLTHSASVGIYILILLGAYVRGSGATYACISWPLCRDSLIFGGGLEIVHMIHRFAAVLVGVLVVVTVLKVWRYRRSQAWWGSLSMILGGLFVSQVVIGAAIVLTNVSPAMQALHLSLGMAAWSASIALTTLVRLGRGTSAEFRVPSHSN
ncbi:MAG: COX15/CtaA family protein [Chloroflexi bacterium]|nr:COX15/CtaA family protein [Chloroflexota bacterium]